MRRFRDVHGAEWDVVVGKESWGTLCALFVPVTAGADIRQAVLSAVTALDAETQIDEMNDVALNQMLDRAIIREQP